jgi:hypothetical protein
MYQTRLYSGVLIAFFLFTGCDRYSIDLTELPEIRIQPVSVIEGDLAMELLPYSIQLEKDFREDLVIYWSTLELTAFPGEDFTEQLGEQVTLPAGKTSLEIPIGILGDTIMEFTEFFEIRIHYDFLGMNQSARAIITIENDDLINPSLSGDGYITSLQYPGMKLIWHDEFDGDQVNSEYWNYDAPNAFPMNCGGSDDEIGRYTGDDEHMRIRDGKLILTATYDPFTGIHRSSRVNSKEKVIIKYGRIDIRAKLAPGAGMASGLQLLGNEGEWPAGGEIDVLKMAGKDCESIIGGLVYEKEGARSLENKSSFTDPVFNLIEYFHLYTLIWEEDRITWMLDYDPFFSVSRQTFPAEYIFNNYFFIKINLAVGGNFGGLPGPVTEFPSELEIDYIRVYQPVEFQNYD